jgi:hypothetical protein
MAWLLATGLLIVALLILYSSRRTNRSLRHTNRGSDTELAPRAPTISVSIAGPSVRSASDTGVPRAGVAAGSWVINPQSSLPLTIYPADRETAYQIKTLIDQGGDRLRVSEFVRSLMLKKGLRCKEIDDYVTRFKQEYFSTIDRLKRESSEWSAASELDRADLLQEFRTKAVERVIVKCCGSPGHDQAASLG